MSDFHQIFKDNGGLKVMVITNSTRTIFDECMLSEVLELEFLSS